MVEVVEAWAEEREAAAVQRASSDAAAPATPQLHGSYRAERDFRSCARHVGGSMDDRADHGLSFGAVSISNCLL